MFIALPNLDKTFTATLFLTRTGFEKLDASGKVVEYFDEKFPGVVPDLITVFDVDTGVPINTEALRFGQRVAVFGISTPAIMRTPEALAVFGPHAFGLDEDWTPLEELHAPASRS